jgi:acyl carrier protein
MDRGRIEAQVKDILVEKFEIPEGKIKPGARFKEDLGIDSIDGVDMIVYLEKSLGKKIPFTDLIKLQTLNDLYETIERALKEP